MSTSSMRPARLKMRDCLVAQLLLARVSPTSPASICRPQMPASQETDWSADSRSRTWADCPTPLRSRL